MATESLAGVARVDITPRVGVMLECYHRKEPSTGVLDPLYVTGLALAADRDAPFLLIGIDNAALLVSETDPIREAVAAALSVKRERVMVFLNHTHSGPRVSPEYLAALQEKAVEAAEGAVAELAPAMIGWGIGSVDASVNNRPKYEDRDDLAPASRPVPDQRVGILRVDRADGKPLATLIWYAAHGNVLTRDSNVISADWPGAARQIVESALGCTALVAVGAAGNVNPRWRGSEDALRRMGLAVGGEALKVFARIEPEPIAALQVRSETIPLKLQPIPDEASAEKLAAEAAEAWGVSTEAWLAEVRRCRERGEIERSLPMEVHVARLNDGVLGGIPMELFSEIGLAVADYLPGKPVFFGGYTNGWIGYLPTPEEYPSGGWQVDWAPVVYGVESGFLTSAVPQTASEVIATAAHLISQAGLRDTSSRE